MWNVRREGFTLVELMVAMSIFLLILVGIFQVFDPSSDPFETLEKVFTIQFRKLRVSYLSLNLPIYASFIVPMKC